MAARPPVVNYRLRPGAVAPCDLRLATFHTVTRWYKAEFGDHARAVSHTTFKHLTGGGVVGGHAVRVLVRFLNRHSGRKPYDAGRYAFAAVAEPTADPATPEHRALDLWKASWLGLLNARDAWGRGLVDDADAVPRTEAEVRDLAAALRSAGRKALGRDDADADALAAAGEAVIRRPGADLADWLVRVWRAVPHAVLRAVARPPGGRPAACGATVTLPLTPAAFDAYARGELAELAVGPAELRYPSRDLVVFAVTDDPAGGVPPGTRRNAQLLTGVYQFAALCPLLVTSPRGPRVACAEVYPDVARRARTFGFAPTGGVSPGLGVPVLALENPAARGQAPPDRPRAERVALYGAFLGTLLIVQSLHYRSYRRARLAARRCRTAS